MNFTLIIDRLLSLLKSQFRSFKSLILRIRFFITRKLSSEKYLRFSCNICGKESVSPLSVIKHREAQSCYHCGSNRRFRTIIAALSNELLGEIIPLPDFKESKQIFGIGLSDSDIYANPLSRIFSYENMYYHKNPRLDITTISKYFHNTADFIIASDVFEHIPPPIDIAFVNLHKILKNGGVCVFSVPYKNQGTTEEHFGELFDYKIITKKGKKVLINKTLQGDVQNFEKLRFHGGPGATLEMRLFSKPSLIKNIKKAGFTNIKLYNYAIPEFGILLDKNTPSLVISMRKL